MHLKELNEVTETEVNHNDRFLQLILVFLISEVLSLPLVPACKCYLEEYLNTDICSNALDTKTLRDSILISKSLTKLFFRRGLNEKRRC
jgi:hypothetical protein